MVEKYLHETLIENDISHQNDVLCVFFKTSPKEVMKLTNLGISRRLTSKTKNIVNSFAITLLRHARP